MLGSNKNAGDISILQKVVSCINVLMPTVFIVTCTNKRNISEAMHALWF